MKKILGVGNALVDIMVKIDDDHILNELDLPKGSMQLVDKARSNKVLERVKAYEKSQSAGGSTANTIHGLGMLGAKAGFIGVVGEDEIGGSFVRDMINAGVDLHMVHSKGCCACNSRLRKNFCNPPGGIGRVFNGFHFQFQL
jgi:sugar/nucleoside kinase (ribokinase family)